MDKNTTGRPQQVVVEPGPVPEIFVTNILPIEQGDEFVRLTFCAEHRLGAIGNSVEMHIVLRVVMTLSGYAELIRYVMAVSQEVH